MSDQKYCSQKVFLYCAQDDFESLTGKSGWYDRDGNKNQQWVKLGHTGRRHGYKIRVVISYLLFFSSASF